jgi:hypothetical protein
MGFVKRGLNKDIHSNSQGYARIGKGHSESEEREADPPDQGSSQEQGQGVEGAHGPWRRSKVSLVMTTR